MIFITASRKPTIAAMIEENSSLSTLTKLVKASNLSDTLDQDGSYTIFAPNNDAFARVPDNVINWWLKPENSDELRSILLRHLWPTIYLAKVIKKEDLDVETVGGDMIRTERSNNGNISFYWSYLVKFPRHGPGLIGRLHLSTKYSAISGSSSVHTASHSSFDSNLLLFP